MLLKNLSKGEVCMIMSGKMKGVLCRITNPDRTSNWQNVEILSALEGMGHKNHQRFMVIKCDFLNSKTPVNRVKIIPYHSPI